MFLINGEITSVISCQDRGLQFGDGLFETMAVVNGEIMHWPEHWQRLLHGCKRLFLPAPDESVLIKEIKILIDESEMQKKFVIKLVYTRGVSQRGYHFDEIQPTRILSRSNWPAFNVKNVSEGIELYLCETRLANQPLLAGIKHLNRLENVLARHEWSDSRYAEGIMRDQNDYIVEGTMSNVFFVKHGALHTPDLSHCGVAGITRQRIIHAAKNESISIYLGQFNTQHMLDADEVFICNSLIGIWPVNKIQSRDFSTNQGNNAVTRLLQQKTNLST